jgi:hypothetical protein
MGKNSNSRSCTAVSVVDASVEADQAGAERYVQPRSGVPN